MIPKYKDKQCNYALFFFILPTQNFPCLTIFFTLSPQMFFSLPQNFPKIFFPLTSFIFYTKVSFLTQKGLEVARCLPTEGLYMFHMLILLL